MLIRELYDTREDGVKLYRTYSDENYFIRKIGTNQFYEDALDIENTPFEYAETNKKILSAEELQKILEESNNKKEEIQNGF